MPEFLLALRLALAALLYLFLGVAFYTLWRELGQDKRAHTLPPAPAQIVVEAGPDEGQRVALRPITAIGRAESNPLMIRDPFASANHAIILWRETLWWLEDLESHNGTYVNGTRVTQPVPLTSGDRIRIGETILRFDAVCETEN